jgi:hypothetical protein
VRKNDLKREEEECGERVRRVGGWDYLFMQKCISEEGGGGRMKSPY